MDNKASAVVQGREVRDGNPGSGPEDKEKQADLRDVKALAGHSN